MKIGVIAVALFAFGFGVADAQGTKGGKNQQQQETPEAKKAREQKERIAKATDAYKSGDIDGAKTQLEALYTEIPEDVDVQTWLGFIYLRTNEPAKAVPLLEKAAKVKDKDLEVQTNLGNA